MSNDIKRKCKLWLICLTVFTILNFALALWNLMINGFFSGEFVCGCYIQALILYFSWGPYMSYKSDHYFEISRGKPNE